MYFQGTLAV